VSDFRTDRELTGFAEVDVTGTNAYMQLHESIKPKLIQLEYSCNPNYPSSGLDSLWLCRLKNRISIPEDLGSGTPGTYLGKFHWGFVDEVWGLVKIRQV